MDTFWICLCIIAAAFIIGSAVIVAGQYIEHAINQHTIAVKNIALGNFEPKD